MRSGLSFLFGMVIGVVFEAIIVRVVWAAIEWPARIYQIVGIWR